MTGQFSCTVFISIININYILTFNLTYLHVRKLGIIQNQFESRYNIIEVTSWKLVG